jgi:hypothetical protein
VRSHDDGDVVTLFNVGAKGVSTTLPVRGGWRELLASTVSLEATLVTLDPWSFRVFESESVS